MRQFVDDDMRNTKLANGQLIKRDRNERADDRVDPRRSANGSSAELNDCA